MPRRAAEAATVEAASKDAVVSIGTVTPRPPVTPAPLPPTPSGPPPEPGAGNAANGRRLFATLACNSCHAIPGVSTANTCPPLGDIGNIAATRKPGYTSGQYIAESIINTNAYIVESYQPNVMPLTFATLPQDQVNDLVAYLMAQKR
jgi:mono/diheme cytochrome c family protein